VTSTSGRGRPRPVIGMLTHDLLELFGEQWLGTVHAAAALGCDLLCYLGRSLDDPGFGRQSNVVYDLATGQTLDGLIIWTSTLGVNVGQQRMEEFGRRFAGLPVVSVEQPLGGAPVIGMDNRRGMSAAVDHLIEVHGRRRIAFVHGPATHDGARERYQGYLDALARHRLVADPRLVSAHPSAWNPEEAAAAVTGMLAGADRPDAIVAANDDFAVGVLSALRAAGVDAPREIAVVGFDDYTNIRTHDLGFDSETDDETGSVRRAVNVSAGTLALTTVRAPFHELGRRSVEAMVALLRGEAVPPVVTVPTQLVVRRSCGCLPAATPAAPAPGLPDDPIAQLRLALTHRSARLPERWPEQLSAALEREIRGGPPGAFLSLLDEIVRASLRAGESVENCRRMLDALRRQVDAHVAGSGEAARAEAAWVAAQIVLNEAAERHWRYSYVLADKRNHIVREVGQHLMTAADSDELVDTLAVELARLGIPGCYLARYADDRRDTARLLLAYENGRRVDADADVFPAVHLVPAGRLARAGPSSMVVAPLYFKEQQLGFVLFEQGPRLGWIYPALQDQIGSALHRALMAERERQAMAALQLQVRQRQEAETALQRARSELERRVRDRTAELARANDVLTEQIMELERAERIREGLEAQLRQAQKMEAMGRLAGGIAHDFNNLLLVINGNSDAVLRRLPPDDPARGELEDIVSAGEKAASLTRQLLVFSRQQARNPGSLDLNALIRNARTILQRLVSDDVELVTQLAPDLARVWADAGQLEQVIFNLAVNARDAMPSGGVLTVETANVTIDAEQARDRLGLRPGPHVALRVRDTGVGMDQPVLARLFEPFFTTKPPGKGTGLGLATAFGIVRQSGGYIAVTSEPGAGSLFEIHLPAVPPGRLPEHEAQPPRSSVGGGETILLVEDNPEVRRAARRFLTGYGYRVFEAADGSEALRVSADHAGPLDLVITDVVMPGMGGRELVRHLAVSRPGTPVLYISGYADSSSIGDAVTGPSVSLLYKPFTAETLGTRVRDILDRHSGASG
jgi:signal transduction histidine kinase/DNA-binding LacI/PurR family transcriptional regulator